MPIEHSVDVDIEGIVVLGFERDNAGQVVACVAGAVKDVPDHELQILVRKISNNTAQDFTFDSPNPELVLEAEGTSQQGIRFAAADAVIDRVAGTGPPESFKWVLDFSGNELHNHPVPVKPSGLRSMLRITNGKLFTRVVSVNHLLVRNAANPEEPPTLVGKVATKIGLAIELDTPGSVARLSGPNQTITVQPGERLIIHFDQICPSDDPFIVGQLRAHANNYYHALEVPKEEQKEFSSTKVINTGPTPPASPEASCYVGRTGP